MLLSLSLKLFTREVRSGYLTSMLASLILAITIVSGISLFTDRLEQALNTETEEFLGGKLKFESNQNSIKAVIEDLNLEENNLLENDDYFQRTYEEENQISDEHITNFEVDSIEEVRPKLLTEEVNVKTHQDDNENSEPSLFENKSFENESNEEEDYEIPAFLRRQKN